MNGENPPLKPKIDDQYWFELSGQLVQNTQQSPTEAAEKLQTLVQWLWGIFTGGAAIGLTVSGQEFSLGKILLIAGASVSLIAVYWGAVWVQLPIAVEFDPRSPTEIQNAYKLGVAAKNRRLKWTVALSLVAAILVSLALAVAAVSPNQTSPPWFNALIHTQGNSRLLALTAEIGGAGTTVDAQSKVVVKVQPVTSQEGATSGDEYVFIPTGEKGLLQTSLPLRFSSDSVKVILEWNDWRGMTTQLSQIVTTWQQTLMTPALADSMLMR